MLFAVLVALSLISCSVGFGLEIAEGNIRHVQNGRVPNAGAALLPAIVVVPIAYCCVAWGVNLVRPNLGYEIVASYAVLSMAVRCFQLLRARRHLRKLLVRPSIGNLPDKT
jgi:hypothetical protein